ncbi:MAG: PilN domain-containing protein [Oscillatoriales cyanobacterium RM2_1_1]|nr:PilN domain-containing protein [Oscillatoriales cyanobacterium SM2_3_0]NJO44249.1 PilN domain-containing protein [Oscillatoriales cyanobacterium RM2_1_1]
MYSLDINFLNDRPDYSPQAEKRSLTPNGAPIDRRPILVGAAVALAANALMGGVWLVFSQRNANLQRELDELTARLGEKTTQVQALDQIYAQAGQANAEADALAGVFNEVKPWSALSVELAELMQTAGVKIKQIQETAPAPVAPPPPPAEGQPAAPVAPPPPETATLEISGEANSLTQVNDFVLLLNQSPFFSEEGTQLVSANLVDNPTQLVVAQSENGTSQSPDLQPIIDYKITTKLSPKTASELLPELKSKGASGLVNRIETLQRKGVIQQ